MSTWSHSGPTVPDRPYSYLIFLCREFWDDLSESPGNHSHCNYEHSLDEFWVDFFQLPGNRIPCICFWCLYAENLIQFSDYFYEWHSNYIHCILFHVQKNPLQNLLALDSLYLSHFLTEWAEILRAYSLSGKFKFRHKTVILHAPLQNLQALNSQYLSHFSTDLTENLNDCFLGGKD